MKRIILLAVVTVASANYAENSDIFSVRGYNRRVAIPLGEAIRKQEEAFVNQSIKGKVVGGTNSTLGQFRYQAGVLTNYTEVPDGIGVCGGSLISANRIVHAAHCWDDGEIHGYASEIVLGSITLFSGGTRQTTTKVIVHPLWNPDIIRNDVAVIFLKHPVKFSSIIGSIALPSGSQLEDDFADEIAVASGFGQTADTKPVTYFQTLNHVNLHVISNDDCRDYFPGIVVHSNVCTNGTGGDSVCRGDSGGPLAVTSNGTSLLIGITSFGSFWGCEVGLPAVYSRVSSFVSFFKEHLETPEDSE